MGALPLLRDVIKIKESISTSDFVLSLAEATTSEGTRQALKDYVVTDGLLKNFDEALDLIKAALDGHASKAAYLHGSFGSGKSHFMAVLHALLRDDPAARARRDLDPLLADHEWLRTEGRRFLLVPFHMMGAKAIEQRVLGGYVDYVRKLHPDAPIPQVYRTDALFIDVRSQRAQYGDAAVIKALSAEGPEAGAEDDEWGETFTWTPELLDAALAAPEATGSTAHLNLVHPSSPAELRAKLVNDASTRILPGFMRNAAENEAGFISLDAGLSVIAEHAKALGYDGLILFLDELILWLATLIHDQRFVAREAGKISNLVEGGDARRAIPIVSFIARQRDLRELVGEEVGGAAEAAIRDTLNLAHGRFDQIPLEDRNLPQVTHARLLQPRDADAKALIDKAFEQTRRVGPQIWDTLLGSDKGTTGADEESFRLTYPFSPAFMDTLVHISAALQRSRSGLKLMGELLADHRDDLRLGQLVPLGDLYPVMAQGGDKPFGDSLRVVFDSADKLYKTRLRPYLLAEYNITEDDVDRFRHRRESIADEELAGRCAAFIGDDRLVCTLLLSALAPSVPALRDLTIRRLGALNHGYVTSPIPGAEVGKVRGKVAAWAARFPEIKTTGTETNPSVRLELTGIDVDSVIANAQVNDNLGNRAALARRLLAEELGVARTEARMGADDLNLVWRGTARTLEVIFGDIADEEALPDHEMQPQIDGRWRLVIDMPYSENEYGPAEDRSRMDRLRARQQGERSRTAAWIPEHLSAKRMADFKRLVVIDKALSDEHRFDTQYAVHLNADNRERAKGMLGSQRAVLLKQLKEVFRQAYGLAEKKEADVGLGFSDHLSALPEVPDLTLSIGHSLHGAVRHVAGRLLARQFPAHPNLDPENTGLAVKKTDAKVVFGQVRAAAEARDRRVEVPSRDRKLMARVAGPLGLGQQKEAYFELSTQWADHFRRLAQTEGVTGDLSLIALTDWTDWPEPRGLPDFLVHLVVATFAEMDDRVWVRHGTQLGTIELSEIKERDALRAQPLPAEQVWETARARYAAIFGDTAPELCRGRLVAQFAEHITAQAQSHREPAEELLRRLEEHAPFLGLDRNGGADRIAAARRSLELLRTLAQTTGAKRIVETLAGHDLGEVTPARCGTSIKTAHDVTRALVAAAWDTIEHAEGLGPEGQALLESLRGVARADQQTADLIQALGDTRREVNALLWKLRPAPDPEPVIDRITPPDPEPPGPARFGQLSTTVDSAADALREALADHDGNTGITISWRVVGG